MVAGLESGLEMPPKGDPLTPEEIGKLRRWIDDGAHWPSDSTGGENTDPTDWWSLKPLSLPAVPRVADTQIDWLRNSVDAFVLSRLNNAGLKPSPEADRRTLIRRVYFDLIGLPPAPDVVDEFVKDTDPLAYEHLVNRLLESPQYGERWARHWLDLVHFAESHGHDQDRPRENAWPYRDYVINALNADKPYARFIEEQIAADALYPDQLELTPALGLLAGGPWDESTLASIREDSIDRQIGRYIDRDDIVTTVMSTFTSSTTHCARCHNHKFDPISQADYYALQAVFAGVEKADKLYDADPTVQSRRQHLTLREKSLAARDKAHLASLWTDETRAAFTEWVETLRASEQAWTVLTPLETRSANGATLELKSDQSILVTGERPDKDVYTVTTMLPPGDWVALRLEVLTDDSLPAKGPGRADNGNLHLCEMNIESSSGGSKTIFASVEVGQATADFDQSDWGISKAIDGDAATAWGIHPEEGKPHIAIFEFKTPFTAGDESLIRVTLDQLHGRKHTIGRFRLSVTQQATASRAVPGTMARVASKPANDRTPAEVDDLEFHFWKDLTSRELSALPEPLRVYAGTCDFVAKDGHVPFGKPREVKVLRRGEITQPVADAVPGALSCVRDLPPRFSLDTLDQEAPRRAALAKWISDPKNPLTWRSIVNRVWMHHFGVGLVDTPSDFGRMGSLPSHPELLDWLAVDFHDKGGSLKQLHRTLLLSSTYRQSTQHNPMAAAIDVGNRLLWRGHRHRLDAEMVKDSLLFINGRLDPTMGGPSVKQFVMTPGISVTPTLDYKSFNLDDPANSRRSIYRFLFRTMPDPFMDTLDCPAGDQLVPVRSESVTSLQALALLNNPFVIRQCEHLATRITSTPELATQSINALYRLALQRLPSEDERNKLAAYAAEHGLANACRLVINSNEFLFVE